MRSLLRDRRGVSAFATIIALTPLIVAVGAEAGSWYVTKQVAQNAADAAAYSGALRLECTLAGSCLDTQSVAYRGKENAAQNAFCNAGDTSYPNSLCSTSLGKNVSQSVAIDIGDYSGGTFTTPPASSGNAVRAKVSQTQPAYLSAILGLLPILPILFLVPPDMQWALILIHFFPDNCAHLNVRFPMGRMIALRTSAGRQSNRQRLRVRNYWSSFAVSGRACLILMRLS